MYLDHVSNSEADDRQQVISLTYSVLVLIAWLNLLTSAKVWLSNVCVRYRDRISKPVWTTHPRPPSHEALWLPLCACTCLEPSSVLLLVTIAYSTTRACTACWYPSTERLSRRSSSIAVLNVVSSGRRYDSTCIYCAQYNTSTCLNYTALNMIGILQHAATCMKQA